MLLSKPYVVNLMIFDHLYYYSGLFERALAGSLVEFTPEGGQGMHAMFRLEVLHPRRGALYVNVKCYSAIDEFR